MRPRAPLGWRDVRTGVGVLLLLIPVAGGVFFLDSLRRIFLEGPSLVVVADDIRGLATSADVWVAGHPAGRVAEISFLGSGEGAERRVAVRLVLLRDAAPALRRDAEAHIGGSALLEPAVVKLTPGSPDAPPFDFADTLSVSPTLDIDDFRALADSGRAAAGDPSEELDALGEELRTGSGTLPRLRRDPQVRALLARQETRLASLREAWTRESGLRALVADSALRAGAGRIAGRTEGLTSDTAAVRTAEVRERLREALDSLAERTDRISRRIDDGEGTLGRLATDEELRDQAARTRALVDSVRTELLRNPLRHLRFRLF
ncbi:MAG: MlaD family protein [Gemmatimonadota bacterium]